MSNCELCGREDNLVNAFVEGVKFKVCSNCKCFGKIIEEKSVKKFDKKNMKKEESFDDVVVNYSEIIKFFREKNGLSQIDFANKLNEKESTMAKIEQGNLKPSIELARKLEKFIGIKLVTKEKILEAPVLKNPKAGLTIGDFIKKAS